MIELYFYRKGLYSTLQDLGRKGYQDKGIPVAGAMDLTAAQQANWLVGNPINSPVLEITLLGPKIQIIGDCQLAITGAQLSPLLNGKSIPNHQTINLHASNTLSFGKPIKGCRAYLAIGGQWQVQSWLGSCSPAPSHWQQLTPDSIIQEHSQIFISPKHFIQQRIVPDYKQVNCDTSTAIRVLRGPEFERFSAYSIGHFFSQLHPISLASNRMGYRLNSQLVDFLPEQELISSGILAGTIQVSNAGQPIVLMKDAQTTGGYYRLANVLTADLDRLAQFKPSDTIRFALVG